MKATLKKYLVFLPILETEMTFVHFFLLRSRISISLKNMLLLLCFYNLLPHGNIVLWKGSCSYTERPNYATATILLCKKESEKDIGNNVNYFNENQVCQTLHIYHGILAAVSIYHQQYWCSREPAS